MTTFPLISYDVSRSIDDTTSAWSLINTVEELFHLAAAQRRAVPFTLHRKPNYNSGFTWLKQGAINYKLVCLYICQRSERM